MMAAGRMVGRENEGAVGVRSDAGFRLEGRVVNEWAAVTGGACVRMMRERETVWGMTVEGWEGGIISLDSGEYVKSEIFLDCAFSLYVETSLMLFLEPGGRRFVGSRGDRRRSRL